MILPRRTRHYKTSFFHVLTPSPDSEVWKCQALGTSAFCGKVVALKKFILHSEKDGVCIVTDTGLFPPPIHTSITPLTPPASSL